MNIVIKTPKFIGDTIMTLPAFELLKQHYRDATFTIVCPEPCVDIFRGKNIDKFIIDKGKKNRIKNTKEMISELKKEHYDLGVLFHNTFLDALIFKLSNIDTIIGYDKENRKILLDFWLKIDRSRHYINHYAILINRYLENGSKTLPSMRLHHNQSKLIKRVDKPLIGFLLGGKNKDTRHYPPMLANEFFESLSNNIDIVLLGDKQDIEHNSIYEKALKSNSIKTTNLTGQTSISEFIDAISSLDLLVTIDSSAMHIAAATNTPFIVLTGKGTSPFDTVYPKVTFGTIIEGDPSIIEDADIIKSISPLAIKDAINEKLKGANA